MRQEDAEGICEWLKQVDMAELRDAVEVHVDSELHVGFFGDRKKAWKQIKTNVRIATYIIVERIYRDLQEALQGKRQVYEPPVGLVKMHRTV